MSEVPLNSPAMMANGNATTGRYRGKALRCEKKNGESRPEKTGQLASPGRPLALVRSHIIPPAAALGAEVFRR
jgi:hypothetical protein